MKKRVLSLLMALVLCFSMLPTAVLAGEADTAAQKAQSTDGTDGAYANGEGTKAPEGIALMAANAADMPQGTGTAEDPYLIGTKEELQWFRDTVNDGEPGICAKLTANIKFKDGDGAWAPIGTEENQYTGTFDGNDYTITFTYATAPTGMEKGWGLFGYIGSDGTVQALNMIINYFGWSGNSFKVPESGALAAYNAGTIERCTAINSYQLYVTGAVGLLAYQNDGTIQDCLANIG